MGTKFLLENRKGRERVRPKRGWEDTIKMDSREMGWEGVDWMHLAQRKD